jgi:hypothetical protein
MDFVENAFRKPILNDDDFRKTRTLIDRLPDEDITRELANGEFLAFIVCRRLFRDQPPGARVVQSFLQRILKIPRVLHKPIREPAQNSTKGLTIIDLVIIYSRSDVIYQILSVVEDSSSFGDPGRTSCLISLLAENLENEKTKELRGQIMDLLRTILIDFDVNPNLEICNPHHHHHTSRSDTLEPYILTDPVFSLMKSRGLLRKSFINYVGGCLGAGDAIQDYRNRIRKHLTNSTNANVTCSMNRETLFSLYLRKANNYRHRDT